MQVRFVDGYDTHAGAVPAWARESLAERAAGHGGGGHGGGEPQGWQLEGGCTGDALWDAAQRELVLTGYARNRPAESVPTAGRATADCLPACLPACLLACPPACPPTCVLLD